MKESLAIFRKAVNESADLQEKIMGGADLVELGKENGHDFSLEDVKAAYDELQDSEEGLTEFELEAVAGGGRVALRGEGAGGHGMMRARGFDQGRQDGRSKLVQAYDQGLF